MSVIISLPASCPIFTRRTFNIVMSAPRHSFFKPSSFIILLKACKVFLYAFLPVDTEACLRISATSKGFPINAPSIPLNAERPIF